MQPGEFPTIQAVDVIRTQPETGDLKSIRHIASEEQVSLDEVAYLVRIAFETVPPPSALGFALYLDDYRIRKYWGYPGGIYFKVYNPRFFKKHGGKQFRFSVDGREFYDTGVELPKLESITVTEAAAGADAIPLPTQADVLQG